MLIRRCCYSVLFAIIPMIGYCQKHLAHSIYLELGGNGGMYSLNYEYKTRNSFVAKIGGSISYGDTFVPISFGKVFFDGAHHLELSMGLTYVRYDQTPGEISDDFSNTFFICSFLGYRHDKMDKRFFYKAGITPFYLVSELPNGLDISHRFFPSFGFGAGIKLGKKI